MNNDVEQRILVVAVVEILAIRTINFVVHACGSDVNQTVETSVVATSERRWRIFIILTPVASTVPYRTGTVFQ